MPIPPGCEPACRGCFHRSVDLEESLNQKTTWLLKVLSPWKDRVLPFHALPNGTHWGYRKKVALSAIWSENGWLFGLKNPKGIVPLKDCPIHDPFINQTIHILQKYLPGPDLLPLSHYLQSGKQLVLVVNASALTGLRWPESLFRELLDAGSEGIWLHLNPESSQKVLSRHSWQFLFGRQRSLDEHHLFYGPMSYPQVIPQLYRELLISCLSFFNIVDGDGIADLYCGMGGSLVAWTRSGAEAIGVEINSEAVECARMNVVGTLVLRGKCEERLDQVEDWIRYKEIRRFLLFANPPKAGMHPKVLDWITQIGRPRRMAYVSAHPKTMRQEMDHFTMQGYEIIEIHPFDSFPATHHIECLALLEDSRTIMKS